MFWRSSPCYSLVADAGFQHFRGLFLKDGNDNMRGCTIIDNAYTWDLLVNFPASDILDVKSNVMIEIRFQRYIGRKSAFRLLMILANGTLQFGCNVDGLI